MTDPGKPPEAPPEAPVDEPGFWDRLRTVMDEHIGATLGKLFDTGKADVTTADDKPGGDPAPGKDRSDVAAEVKREVEKLRADEAAQQAKASDRDRITALEQKLAKAAENPPEEFRKITEWMWR